MNTTDLLSIANAICPDRDCMVFEGRRWSYSETDERSNRLAGALKELGITQGDRVGFMNVNCNQYVETYFAAAKLGAIFVPFNYRAKADELLYMADHAEIKIIFTGGRYLDLVESILPHAETVRHCVSMEADVGTRYEDLIRSSSAEATSAEIADDDITILMYTSGTTGRPKAVPLRHDAFVGYVLENVEPINPDTEERNILSVPLYHVAGVQSMFPAVYGGRTMVLMRQFEVKEWLETVQRERATRAMLVPTMLKRIVDEPELHKYDLSSLSVITYGSARMPFDVIRKAIDLLPHVQFINGYGQTETASTLTTLGPEDHRIDGSEAQRQKKLYRLAGSIGRPLSDVEVRIVDEIGTPLPAKCIGEIEVRGPRVMKGYWGNSAKTTQVMTEDGWLRTGDMGYLDEEGYVFLTGRADDMIIRGGENIAPEEVEGVLVSHPKIIEAAVIGVPDAEFGQQLIAICVLQHGTKCTSEEIMEYCRERMAGFKRPRQIVFTDSLPRNSMDKVLRNKLREEYQNLNGNPEPERS